MRRREARPLTPVAPGGPDPLWGYPADRRPRGGVRRDHVSVLVRRCVFLERRIADKGLHFRDEAERRALEWALNQLEPGAAPELLEQELERQEKRGRHG